jgi:uncharacterized membrane protein
MIEPALRILLSLLVGFAGVSHFVRPLFFVRIMPSYLPRSWDYPLVYFTGICEIAGAIALQVPVLRRPAAIALMAFFVAVFPANVQAALEPERMNAPAWAAWARLPLQAALIWWASRYAR